MFCFPYDFLYNLCNPNIVQIIPIDENPIEDIVSFDIAIERTVYKLLCNKINRDLKITFDDYNTIYFLPDDKKIRIIQLINRLIQR